MSEKAPRYDGLKPASDVSSRVKRANRAKGTTAERLLRRTLWSKGLRYHLHADDLPGRPDIVFRRARVAVFVDGDFWHGRNWDDRKSRLADGANPGYWINKIEYNMRRDQQNAETLSGMGWTVIRLWETDVRRDMSGAVARIERALAPSDTSLYCEVPHD